MRIIAVLCLFLALNGYSQNFYQAMKGGKKGLKIMRTITVSPKRMHLAYQVAARRAYSTVLHNEAGQAVVIAQMRQPICTPMEMAGGYNYLRFTSRLFDHKKLDKFPQWKDVKRIGSYGGVHHIVTQTVINAIAKEEGIKDVKEMKANAPGVYSPLHGVAEYGYLFHDHPNLLEIYHEKGVKGIVVNFFDKLNEIHQELDLPVYDENMIATELEEAKLWAIHWGIRWE